MQDNDKNPQQIVEKEGLTQQSDPKVLEKIVKRILLRYNWINSFTKTWLEECCSENHEWNI